MPEQEARRLSIRWPSLRRRLVLYGAVPSVVIGGLVAMYYSGNATLRNLVSPDAPTIPENLRREFGLLESLQIVCLAALALVAVQGLRRKRSLARRAVLWALLIGSIWMICEETDYGCHYLDLLRGDWQSGEPVEATNIHSIGYVRVVLLNIAIFGTFIFFGGFAIVFHRSPNAALRYLAPDRLSVLTVLLVTAIYEVALKLAARMPPGYGSLDGHEGEFAELGLYYLVLLYAVDVIFWRRLERAP
jgi:hypothetical protein